MAQKPINAEGGQSPLFAGRVSNEQAAWIAYAKRKYGLTKGELLRLVIEIARSHEEEFAELAATHLHEKELEKRAS